MSAPERIWAWKDTEFEATLWNTHGDTRYTPDFAEEYIRADIANAERDALLKRVGAADKLANQFGLALAELDECSLELTSENYNCPDHNAALAAYRATGEKP